MLKFLILSGGKVLTEKIDIKHLQLDTSKNLSLLSSCSEESVLKISFSPYYCALVVKKEVAVMIISSFEWQTKFISQKPIRSFYFDIEINNFLCGLFAA